jgi:hypothetical protein
MPTTPDLTGKMMGHGVYGRHSLAQHSAGGFGLPGLRRAAQAAASAVATAGPSSWPTSVPPGVATSCSR